MRIVIELSRYSGFFLSNCETYDVIIMSINPQGRVHFRIYLLNIKSLDHDNWSTNRYVQYCAFMTIFLRNTLHNVEDWVIVKAAVFVLDVTSASRKGPEFVV